MRFWTRASPNPDQKTDFIYVDGEEQLDRLIAESGEQPAVLLVHDPYCGISGRAYAEVEKLGGKVFLILTGDGRHLSKEVQARTGIRHESPQAFIFSGGKVTWSASHFGVRKDVLRRELDALGGSLVAPRVAQR